MHEHERYMHKALALAEQGRGSVEPNPMVGAVIIRDGQVIGRGRHERFGQPHAEINALENCHSQGHDPAGASMYLNLEPCSHTGKTPPCADALIAARLARVIVAMNDPFPQVAGRGIEKLRQAGIEVITDICHEQARQLNAPYIKRVNTGLPWVILKWAQTLDGKIATASGDSRWISNPDSRRYVHHLRARVDAVMVGIGTALADDPQLTARDVPVQRIARRVVLDPQLRLPEGSQLAQSLDEAPLTLAVREALLREPRASVEQWRQRGVEIISLPRQDRPQSHARLDLQPLLKHLAEQHQATNVLVEGGAALAGALLNQGLVDELIVFVGPKLMGDPSARTAVRIGPCATISQTRPLVLCDMARIGDDVMLNYRIAEA